MCNLHQFSRSACQLPSKRGKRVLIPYRLIFLDHRSLDSPPVSLSQHECTDATQSQIDYECLTSGSCVLVGRELCVLQPAPWPVIRCPSTAAKSLLPTPWKISPRDCFTVLPVKNPRSLETGHHPDSICWDAGTERERKRRLRYE